MKTDVTGSKKELLHKLAYEYTKGDYARDAAADTAGMVGGVPAGLLAAYVAERLGGGDAARGIAGMGGMIGGSLAAVPTARKLIGSKHTPTTLKDIVDENNNVLSKRKPLDVLPAMGIGAAAGAAGGSVLGALLGRASRGHGAIVGGLGGAGLGALTGLIAGETKHDYAARKPIREAAVADKEKAAALICDAFSIVKQAGMLGNVRTAAKSGLDKAKKVYHNAKKTDALKAAKKAKDKAKSSHKTTSKGDPTKPARLTDEARAELVRKRNIAAGVAGGVGTAAAGTAIYKSRNDSNDKQKEKAAALIKSAAILIEKRSGNAGVNALLNAMRRANEVGGRVVRKVVNKPIRKGLRWAGKEENTGKRISEAVSGAAPTIRKGLNTASQYTLPAALTGVAALRGMDTRDSSRY